MKCDTPQFKALCTAHEADQEIRKWIQMDICWAVHDWQMDIAKQFVQLLINLDK